MRESSEEGGSKSMPVVTMALVSAPTKTKKAAALTIAPKHFSATAEQ